jgi:hypothetical protein
MGRRTAWEYHVEAMPSMSLEQELVRMNELGSQGWEVCAIWPSSHHMLFKRRKVQDNGK